MSGFLDNINDAGNIQAHGVHLLFFFILLFFSFLFFNPSLQSRIHQPCPLLCPPTAPHPMPALSLPFPRGCSHSPITVFSSRQSSYEERRNISNFIDAYMPKRCLWPFTPSRPCYTYSVVFRAKSTQCEFCNIAGLLTEIQCKSKRLRKNFKHGPTLSSAIQAEDEGVDMKHVSSTSRSGKGARLFFHTVSCFFMNSVCNRHTLQVPSVSLQAQDDMTLTAEERRLLNTVVTAHRKSMVPVGEISALVCIHYWQEITCNECYQEMIARTAKKPSVIIRKKIL